MKEKYQNQDEKSNPDVFRFSGNLFGKIVNIVIDFQQDMRQFFYDVGVELANATIAHEVEMTAGEKGKHLEERSATRWTPQPGFVRIFDRKVKVMRPRLRTPDKKHEVPLRTYEAFQNDAHDQEMVLKRMIRGVSTRDYEGAVNEFLQGYGLSRGAVDKQFIRASKKKLEELMNRRFENKRFLVIGIDGTEMGGEMIITGIGVKDTGEKEVMGIYQGATENAEACTGLIEDLVERGLSTSHRILFIIDGSKALRKAIKSVFGDLALIQRCQLHKRRNVKRLLAPKHQVEVDRMLAAAYNTNDHDEVKRELERIVGYLDNINSSAAGSLREGLEETLTVHKLGVTGELRKTLSNTNFVESPFSIAKPRTRRVKRWRNSSQILRWSATALLEAERRFKRVKGFRQLKDLAKKLGEENLIAARV